MSWIDRLAPCAALLLPLAMIGCGGVTEAASEGSGTGESSGGTTTTSTSTSTTLTTGATMGSESADSGDSGDSSDSGQSTTGPMPVCGNGEVEIGEECDLGPQNGTGMYCKLDCTTNFCGDAYMGPGELCDDGNRNDADECTNTCTLTSCGDGAVQRGEQCDDMNAVETDECLSTCVSASCGDQQVWGGIETCDGNNVGAQTCAMQGFDGGTLLCQPDCSGFDTSGCTYTCGDGNVDPGEQCDGANLGGQTCMGLGHDGGALTCGQNCHIDQTACTDCGDGVVEGAEQCDGAVMVPCADLPNPPSYGCGTATCTANCTYDLGACELDVGEACMNGMQCCSNTCFGMPTECCFPQGYKCDDDPDCVCTECCSGTCAGNGDCTQM